MDGYLTRRAVAIALLAVSVGACSGSKGSTDTSGATSPASPLATASASPEPKSAQVGGTLTLRGTDEGSTVDVTVRKVIDPYTLQSEVLVPEAGTRLVALDLKMTNSGTVAYTDSPANGAVLFDVDDVEWKSVVTGEDAGLVSVTMGPGDSKSGLVYFQLPEKLKIRRFQLTLNSGFGPETGEWLLG